MAAKTALGDAVISVWRQALGEEAEEVELDGETYSVGRTRGKKLRVVRFQWKDYKLDGIEQNPHTSSRWAKLAKEGKKIMQFSFNKRYVGSVCDGKLMRYPAWKSLDLPE
jgi:hypothetical protein